MMPYSEDPLEFLQSFLLEVQGKAGDVSGGCP